MPETFLVRQPLFNRSEAAVGYELRFRDDADGGDAFVRSYMSGAFDILRSGLPAYVRATEDHLLNGIFRTPHPRTLAVLLPPNLSASSSVVDAVQQLAQAGVNVGLDEFVLPRDKSSPVLSFLPHAKFVRIDMRGNDPAAFGPLVAGLKRHGKTSIADHVADAAMHNTCSALGFDVFQGTYFARPEPLPAAEIPTSTAAAIRLMALARSTNTSEREIEQVVSADPGITYQLLRIVNSAAIGGRGIRSIAHALRLVGRNNLVRWLALASYANRAGKSGVDDELVRQAVQRAHFCEALAARGAGRDRGTAFLVGLFSLLDAVFRMPLSEVLERVNLADEVKDALVNRSGPYADALRIIEAYELGLWESAAEASEFFNLSADELPALYQASLKWALEHIPASSKARVAKSA